LAGIIHVIFGVRDVYWLSYARYVCLFQNLYTCRTYPSR